MSSNGALTATVFQGAQGSREDAGPAVPISAQVTATRTGLPPSGSPGWSARMRTAGPCHPERRPRTNECTSSQASRPLSSERLRSHAFGDALRAGLSTETRAARGQVASDHRPQHLRATRHRSPSSRRHRPQFLGEQPDHGGLEAPVLPELHRSNMSSRERMQSIERWRPGLARQRSDEERRDPGGIGNPWSGTARTSRASSRARTRAVRPREWAGRWRRDSSGR